MTGYLTTHVLDTARGCPAAGIAITLYRLSGQSHRKIAQAVTNADGRTDAPILPAALFRTGVYELIFHTGAYLATAPCLADGAQPDVAGDAAGRTSGDVPRFLDDIPIRFGMADPLAHYHVPLLLSPFGYSTYRGS